MIVLSKRENFKNLRLPSGNEFGTNDLWLPGGKLPNDKVECIIETEGMIINIDYKITDI